MVAIEGVVSNGRIRADCSVREEFAGRSTGSKCACCNRRAPYYETKGAAVCAFDEALAPYGLCLDPDGLADFPNDSGRRTVDVYTTGDGHGDGIGKVGFAVISWYRMESGNYEFTGYLA